MKTARMISSFVAMAITTKTAFALDASQAARIPERHSSVIILAHRGDAQREDLPLRVADLVLFEK